MTLQKAYFVNLDMDDPANNHIEVQFNPTDLTYSKGAQFAELDIPGLDSPVLQFIRGTNETVTLNLFFDTTESGMGLGAQSVTDWTDKFYALVKQNPETHAPPRCRFSWGPPEKQQAAETAGQLESGGESLSQAVSNAPYWFTCVVESVERNFLLFSPQGVPLRARLTVKLREYKTIEQMVAELHSADHTRARVLKRRERLDQVSAEAYNTPAEWRRIAEANDLDDPRRVPPGTILQIPPIRTESATRRPG